MNEVSLFRLYLLRGVYLFIVVGLFVKVWPEIIHHDTPWELKEGVVNCMLAAFSLLCALGLRYPLQMLPILIWEMLWKAIWLSIVALPLWSSGQMDDATMNVAISCLVVVIVPIGIPWRFVFARYVKKRGDRWR
ncbi:hypothetical protein EHS13_31820 [Paenibacillus psychroresistens]|uniref:Uncharacterized protein n=1 Tax=Paenibacillus psychroresistens TaxID=1778678 RepID=A0A6B8RRX3_9BACL|nr:hypothetical protein [Paenibacillus psychroresistens]QGQ99140.1 hypothetical protein EHS13_31820 [Paenibacillus psychroresistens]